MEPDDDPAPPHHADRNQDWRKKSPKRKRADSAPQAQYSTFAPAIVVEPLPALEGAPLPCSVDSVSPTAREGPACTQAGDFGEAPPVPVGKIPNSPRSMVATQFEQMALGPTVPVLRFGEGAGREGKRVKVKEGQAGRVDAARMDAQRGGKAAVVEVLIPHAKGSPAKKSAHFAEEHTTGSDSTPRKTSPSAHRPKSPPLPSSTGEMDASALAWQDEEITGHLAQDPDDDGYGLNGIGFKPTPAMAYSRLQKRREQILAWKSREAREARQRRAELRRRGGVGKMAVGGGEFSGVGKGVAGRRTVRFA
ncbi:hypothetical protein EJ06DRAFT_557150 [Trichodelitschia bisporula]|uniref:Uncharacterized protein n=1 Tax=Trichodelitschia bisporula TaxID=703511 RepID=A0A6G1HW94_9PEZI|nr:hypothetical protein EJ06DRAFT_557150 [Trichodelitschia bisporula]